MPGIHADENFIISAEPAMVQAIACTTGSALHLRFSDCSTVSRFSAPATAVPPSFPRSLELHPAKGIRMRNTDSIADGQAVRKGRGV